VIALAGKWIVRLTLLLLILCVLTTAIVAFVLNTKSGTAWAIARIDAALPGKLDTAEFDGTLWRGLHFKHIEYADETQRVEVEQLSLNLHWPAVIAGRLSFETLNARAVTRASLRSKPTGPQPFELAMSPLPIVVAVAKASVDELVLTSVDKRQSFQDIDVERVRITESRFQIAKGSAANELLSGSVESFSMALSGKVRTSGEISWELQDGSWSGRGSVRGNLVQLEFQQDVVGQYPATVAGALQILDRIDPEFDALINWDSWLVGGREVLEGEVHLQGVFENYAAAYDTTIVLSEQQRIQLSGTAVGNPEGLSEFEARITAQPGAVDLSGRLAWLPEFSANATARTTNIDPSTFRSELNGRLNATANLILDKDGALTVKGLSVTGILNDAPVRGDGEMRVSSERQHCLECTLHIADNRFLWTVLTPPKVYRCHFH
jgi:autotransporter translocation and assembly factor TamB